MSQSDASFKAKFTEFLEIIGKIINHIWCSLNYLRLGQVNQKEFWSQAYDTAWSSISTVIITNISIGAVSSLQLTKHFAAFGALSEIGGTNAMAQLRELAPVITAIVVTGRIGSAWAAEVGTMKITEQINALKVMKLSPEWFIVAPRVLACMLSMPILNIIAIFSSLLGGYIVAELIAQVGFTSYVNSIKHYVDVYDFTITSFKALCFGGVIASIACSYGLEATGGQRESGNTLLKLS